MKLPDFVEVMTNCDEFNVFADETIKPSNEFDENNQQEIKPYDLDDFCNDFVRKERNDPTEEEEEDTHWHGDNDYYKEENDENEDDAGTSQFYIARD